MAPWVLALFLCLHPLTRAEEAPEQPASQAPSQERQEKSRKFRDDYLRGLDGRALKKEDLKDLQSLAERGYLHSAEALEGGDPKTIQFEVDDNGRKLLVRFSPGLEGAEAAAERFQLGTQDPGKVFTRAFVELADQPFFKGLPSSRTGAQSPDKSSPQRSAVKMRLSKVEPSFDGTVRDSPAPVLAAGLQGHQLGVGKDRYGLYKDGKKVGYMLQMTANGKELLYHQGDKGVYSRTGERLGSYESVAGLVSGRSVPPDLFKGPEALRYRMQDGKLYSPDGTKVGYVPKDPRYGDEKVVFFHGDNKTGYSGAPWTVYSPQGQKLGSYEQVYARNVAGYDGKSERRVLAPAGEYEDKGRKVSLLKGLDGTFYEARSSKDVRPFFSKEEAAQLKQVEQLRQIRELPETTTLERLKKNLMLKAAQTQLDAQFAKKFPIAQYGDLTKDLPAYLRSVSQAGGLEGLRERLPDILAVRDSYQARLDKAGAEFAAEDARTRGQRQALKERMLGSPADARRDLQNRLWDLERPLLQAADRRNNLQWIVSDLDGVLRGLSKDSPVSSQLTQLKALRDELARLPGEDPARRGFFASMPGPQRTAFDTAAGLERFEATKTEQGQRGRELQGVRDALAKAVPGSREWTGLKTREKAIDREIDGLITERRGLETQLADDLTEARSIHRLYQELDAAASPVERDAARQSVERVLGWRLRQDSGSTVESMRSQWTGEGWSRYEALLDYLQGVQSAHSWDKAIKDRRGMFDTGIESLMEPGDDPESLLAKRRLMRM